MANKTFKIKIEGSAEMVNAFSRIIPDETIESWTGLLPNHTAPEVHRYVNVDVAEFTAWTKRMEDRKNFEAQLEKIGRDFMAGLEGQANDQEAFLEEAKHIMFNHKPKSK